MLLDGWEQTQDRVRVIAAEAKTVVTSGGSLSPGWLEGAAAWVGDMAPSWAQLTGCEPLERSYRRVIASPHIEAWLICWPTDGHLQLHDHGGASGAFQVIEGTLDERSLEARGGLGGPGATLHDRLVPPGEVVSFDGAYIHDVRNTHPEAATSIHIYSAASRPMAFYSLDGGLVRTVGPATELALREAEILADRPVAGPAARLVESSDVA
jgi:Cysteine dioxygenase type I